MNVKHKVFPANQHFEAQVAFYENDSPTNNVNHHYILIKFSTANTACLDHE